MPKFVDNEKREWEVSLYATTIRAARQVDSDFLKEGDEFRKRLVECCARVPNCKGRPQYY